MDNGNNIEQFTRMIKDYAGIEKLSAALLNTLIKKITVGEPKEIDGEHMGVFVVAIKDC